MSKPKPAKPHHRFIFRVPHALWRKLVELAWQENRSINRQLIELVENAQSEKEKP